MIAASLQEPEQARRASRPPSVVGSHLNYDPWVAHESGSQRNSLFPWDNAGGSSSVAGPAFDFVPGSATRHAGSSLSSRRGSPAVLSIGISPNVSAFRGSLEHFEFDGNAVAVLFIEIVPADTQHQFQKTVFSGGKPKLNNRISVSLP